MSKNIVANMIRFEKAFGGSESRCFFDVMKFGGDFLVVINGIFGIDLEDLLYLATYEVKASRQN